MSDRIVPGPVDSGTASVREAVCIHTKKVFDGCRDKDCVEDLRVYPTVSSQSYIENAIRVRPRSAQLIDAIVNVQEIAFNRGYYTVDVTYFYKIDGEAFPSGDAICGLAIFDKRVMLFGSEASSKIYSSADAETYESSGLPIGVVESVDPILLHMKVVDRDTQTDDEAESRSVPQAIQDLFNEELVMTEQNRNLYVTIGQFSVIRLERDTQLLIPAYDYCIPDKSCEGTTDDDPCAMFSRIEFPLDEFFPPDTIRADEDYRSLR